MNIHRTNIVGMPYFPGIAVGSLRKGASGGTCSDVVMISQSEINTLKILPAGFLVVEGAPFSHTMIRLLEFGVPIILIRKQQAGELKQGVSLLIDGSTGQITSDIGIRNSLIPDIPNPPAGKSVFTRDGTPIKLCASVRSSTAVRHAVDAGAESIGLVRSEFLMPENESLPTLEFYQSTFYEVCEAAKPLPVTFRLLDLAADKVPKWIPDAEMLGGTLGLQGVRLYGMEPICSVVKAQLEAINRLANDFNMRVLIPYLVRHEELNNWLELIRKEIPQTVPIGAMAETPASVLDIKALLESADFVAIGCNDLMQCLFAADRDRAELRYYLDPYAPLLFNFFKQIADAASVNLENVQLCGILSQLQGVMPVLMGLGYRVFSVDAQFIPYLARIVSTTVIVEAETLASEICTASSTQQVLEILRLPTNRDVPYITG